MKIQVDSDNAWAIVNYHLSAELEYYQYQIKDKIPEDTDQAILFLEQRNLTEIGLYNLLVLKKELLTDIGGVEIPST